jgi:hypothetical protein
MRQSDEGNESMQAKNQEGNYVKGERKSCHITRSQWGYHKEMDIENNQETSAFSADAVYESRDTVKMVLNDGHQPRI